MDPLSILDKLPSSKHEEVREMLRSWMKDVSLGKREYDEAGELLVDTLDDPHVRYALTLALALAETRIDLAIADSDSHPQREITTHKRKIEMLEQQLEKQLDLL